jgi:hypothetical protein
MKLLMRYVMCSIVVALCMIAVGFWPSADVPSGKGHKVLDYGSTA